MLSTPEVFECHARPVQSTSWRAERPRPSSIERGSRSLAIRHRVRLDLAGLATIGERGVVDRVCDLLAKTIPRARPRSTVAVRCSIEQAVAICEIVYVPRRPAAIEAREVGDAVIELWSWVCAGSD
jgi:hypothetical protein